MNRKNARTFTVAMACLLLAWLPARSEGLRSVGLRFAFSWSETPVWIGIEASTTLSWGVFSGALFVTPDGKTLFTSHFDIPMAEEAVAFVRATAGFYYFSAAQPFPYLLAGAGLSYLPLAQSPFYAAFAGEFIYPLAFPMPMFSLSGGWFPSP